MKEFMLSDFYVDKILFSSRVPNGAGGSVHRNREGHGLVMFVGGVCNFDFEGEKYCVGDNEIIYLPKHSNYIVEKPGEHKECYAINFNISEKISSKPFVIRPKNSDYFLNLFKQADSIWRAKGDGYVMECTLRLYKVICGLKKDLGIYTPRSFLKMIEPATEYIHVNYTKDNISIPHLAGLCYMSETYFRRIFTKAKGISPLKYINNLKIERAKELMDYGNCSVSSAAELSGFHDEAYFSREFKKATGVAPSQYKKEGNVKKT